MIFEIGKLLSDTVITSVSLVVVAVVMYKTYTFFELLLKIKSDLKSQGIKVD